MLTIDRRLIVLGTLLSACTADRGTPAEPSDAPLASAHQVVVAANSFPQNEITVSAGTTVTWVWDTASGEREVAFDDGVKSKSQKAGSYSRTFNTVGIYSFQCTHHPGMSGHVNVH